MIVAISQPMLFPWVGLLEQMRAADAFVHYPDVQFSKGGFVNRVQAKTARGTKWLTVPLGGRRLGQKINEVKINDRSDWRREHLQTLAQAYEAAPHAGEMLKLVKSVYEREYDNIGSLAESSEMALCGYFGIDHPGKFHSSQTLGISGSGSQRVLDIVLALGGDTYLTGHGASQYLDHEGFERAGVRVDYMDYAKTPYPQLHGNFTPYVSALDLVANAGRAGIDFIRPRFIYWKDFLRDERNRTVPN